MIIPEVLQQTIPTWTWVGWLATALGWAGSCFWFEQDRTRVRAGGERWKWFGLIFGVLFFLGTWRLGSLIVPYAMLALLTLTGLFLIRTGRLAELLSAAATPRSGLGKFADLRARLGRWLQGTGAGPDPGTAAVALFSKNGSPYGGQDSRTLGAEGSQALALVQDLLARSVAIGATDIHIEPKSSQELQVRFRIDGMLQNVRVIAGPVGPAVISLLKVLGDMDIAERRRPQDGTFAAVVDSRRFDIRGATGPTNFGEKLVLRLLDAEGGIMRGGLDGLGMSPGLSQALRSLVKRSQGMLIVCGPTGSGKTTSIYAAMSEMDVLTRNIVTIEDPIEYRLENISQTAVNAAAGLTFASILRSVLRQDPDVVLIGEVRDKETAEIAMQAALTGHLVLTTLHANDTATTITRLLDLGVDATLIQSTVTAVLAQRLIRLLCPACKVPYRPEEALLRANGLRPGKIETMFKAGGCPRCLGTGYRGRTGIYEFLPMDAPVKALLVGRPSVEKIRDLAVRAGMRTLRQAALRLVIDGSTSLEEAARVA